MLTNAPSVERQGRKVTGIPLEQGISFDGICLAHTIKYCQAAGDDSNRHVATPYEKMIRTQCMQTFGLEDNITASMPALFGPIGSSSAAGSPVSLWPALAGGWPGSNL